MYNAGSMGQQPPGGSAAILLLPPICIRLVRGGGVGGCEFFFLSGGTMVPGSGALALDIYTGHDKTPVW